MRKNSHSLNAAAAVNQAGIPLAKLAAEETGMGIVEDKVIKNHYAAEYVCNTYKNTKTCGVIEEDSAYEIKKIAEPVDIIGAVIPYINSNIQNTVSSQDTQRNYRSPNSRAKKYTASSVDDETVKRYMDNGDQFCI